jgi:hypothetical protein
MKYVLDSSVAFKWAVIESETPKARALRDAYGRSVHELISPDIIPWRWVTPLPVPSGKAGSRYPKPLRCGGP